MKRNSFSFPRPPIPASQARRERGIVLFIALVTMVLLMLAALATLRSVDSTTLMTGNLAFREATTQVSDYGTENARKWLMDNASSLASDFPPGSPYYYASIDASFNPKSWDWSHSVTMTTTSGNVLVGTIPDGYTVKYVIHRMCSSAGAATNCFSVQGGNITGSSNAAANYNAFSPTGSGTPYYQITTQVTGPRNSVSYVQTLVY